MCLLLIRIKIILIDEKKNILVAEKMCERVDLLGLDYI